MEYDLNILMIFGIKEKFSYCYKYTCAAYDWCCAPGTYDQVLLVKENLNQQRLFEVTATASQEQIVVELTECCNIKIIAKYLYASISKCLKLALDP